MSKRRTLTCPILIAGVLALAATASAAIGAGRADSTARPAPVIEVVTLTITPGTPVETFRAADAAVGREHVARQPGFQSRESAAGANGSWLVIVHWRSIADAEASMNSFAKAPAAARFMSLIVPDSMHMTRYGGGPGVITTAVKH